MSACVREMAGEEGLDGLCFLFILMAEPIAVLSRIRLTYSRGQAKPTNKNGNFLMATKYPENVQIG